MEDYREYARIFNTGNDKLLLSTFFSFPFTFTTPFENRTYNDEREFLDALTFYHRVRECIDPQEIVYGKQKVFVNLVIVFHSCVEWVDFAYGPVHPGDMLTTRAFVLYTLNEQNRVVHVKEMYWPPDYLTSSVQRLGSSDMQRAALEALIAGFNAGRFDTVGGYYTEDAVVEYPPEQRLEGRKRIVESFMETARTVNVTFDVLKSISDDSGICLELVESFKAVTDASSFSVKPMKQGEIFSRKIMIVMRLDHGLISNSRSMLLE